VVIGAVVVIFTVTGWAVPLAICGVALDKPQVGAGVTAGVMVQRRATVPLNAAIGVMTSPNFAACPALTVWEVEDPEAEVIEKIWTGFAVVLSSTTKPEFPDFVESRCSCRLLPYLHICSCILSLFACQFDDPLNVIDCPSGKLYSSGN
jgi:hypothetical protein